MTGCAYIVTSKDSRKGAPACGGGGVLNEHVLGFFPAVSYPMGFVLLQQSR